jgi:hypothetical protein
VVETASVKVEPGSCEDVDGTCLYPQFDGGNFMSKGPSNLKEGPVTYIFANSSDKIAFSKTMRPSSLTSFYHVW